MDATSPFTPLTLDYDWLRAFHVIIRDPDNWNTTTGNASFLDALARVCTGNQDANYAMQDLPCAALSISLLIADGIARRADLLGYASPPPSDTGGFDVGQFFINAELSTNFSKQQLQNTTLFTMIRTQLFVETAGYRFHGVTVILAMVVLLLHVALVLGHVCIVLMTQSWTSNAWSSLGELLALAVQSTPTGLLMNAGAGISKGATWKLRVFVRVAQDEERLKLVFSDKLSTRYNTNELQDVPKPECQYG